MTVLIFCVGSSQPSVTLPHSSEQPSSSAEVSPGPLFVEIQILLPRKGLALDICFKCHFKVSPGVFFASKTQCWLPVFQVCSPCFTPGFEELLPWALSGPGCPFWGVLGIFSLKKVLELGVPFALDAQRRFWMQLKAFRIVSHAAGFDVYTSASCKNDQMYKRWW